MQRLPRGHLHHLRDGRRRGRYAVPALSLPGFSREDGLINGEPPSQRTVLVRTIWGFAALADSEKIRSGKSRSD